jgi:hypothetical protein
MIAAPGGHGRLGKAHGELLIKLLCYQIGEGAPRIVPGRPERSWMDETRNRFAYRCLPLTIANSMGWELLCPHKVTVKWNGGPELQDIRVEQEAEGAALHFAASHFGHGVVTFQTSYLFRTEPGTAIWVRGVPNRPKDAIAPLDGVVETDWLNFSFTMNWQFTRPGIVTFERDEPFCFITPVGYHGLDSVVPEVRPLAENAELAAAYVAYSTARNGFNRKLAEGDPETVRRGWQKWYMRGEEPDGTKGNPEHVSKLRLAEPVVVGRESGKPPEQH